MATFFNRRGRPPHPDILTPSEWRVLELIRQGKTNSEIAYELAISVPGVKYHITNMLGKLQVEDRTGLAGWMPEADADRRGRNRWAFGPLLFGIKAPVLGVGVVATAGIVVLGAFALGSTSTDLAPDETASAATSPTPAPGLTMAAKLLAADPYRTRVELTLEWEGAWDGSNPVGRPHEIARSLTVRSDLVPIQLYS